jgi:hypothetical protein
VGSFENKEIVNLSMFFVCHGEQREPPDRSIINDLGLGKVVRTTAAQIQNYIDTPNGARHLPLKIKSINPTPLSLAKTPTFIILAISQNAARYQLVNHWARHYAFESFPQTSWLTGTL